MLKRRRSLSKRDHRPSWRDYQTDSQRGAARPFRRAALRVAAGVLLALIAIAGGQAFLRGEGGPPEATPRRLPAPSELTSKDEVRQLLDEQAFNNLTRKNVELPFNGEMLQVETTLDVGLQSFLLGKMDRKHSRHIGIVVMEADTGRVLAMTGFDKTEPAGNPCLRSHFPAASIFKIVTAASAVDQCGYTADSPMHFNGSKHTLYKRQLADGVNRYTNTVSFQEAFAESVNPVFGKIGGLRLGKPLLEQSADAFGFNEPLDFELPLPPSRFQITDQPYHWAEIASGFNRETTISPLHGAVMASAVLNAGRMVEPSIIENVADGRGKVLYRWQPGREQQAMSPKAAAVLSQLMETTITSGTARKAFRRFRQDNVLSRLQIGGKTGSIDNESHDLRYDWFVGFARERQGKGQVVVAALVAHEKYIGTRASEYARMAMKYYFSQNREQDSSPAPSNKRMFNSAFEADQKRPDARRTKSFGIRRT